MTHRLDIASASQLLSRRPDNGYVEEWTQLIQREKLSEEVISEQSVVIFRLSKEWLAISTLIFAAVAKSRKIHRLPHRSGKILLGIVNLHGQLRLCISLTDLLEIDNTHEIQENANSHKYQRIMAIKKEEMYWIFPVDEVHGIFRCDISQLQNVPVTITKSKDNYLKGVFTWEDKSVGYIDEELLFNNLQRSIL